MYNNYEPYVNRGLIVIKIIKGANSLQVFIPDDMQNKAPQLLATIWCEEFANKSTIILDMTDAVKQFAKAALLNRYILVYV